AVDAAALAGARSMYDRGTNEHDVRRTSVAVADTNRLHETAELTQLDLKRNDTNAPTGNVVIGQYDFGTTQFTAGAAPLDMTAMNAVQANADLARDARAVNLPLGSLMGV